MDAVLGERVELWFDNLWAGCIEANSVLNVFGILFSSPFTNERGYPVWDDPAEYQRFLQSADRSEQTLRSSNAMVCNASRDEQLSDILHRTIAYQSSARKPDRESGYNTFSQQAVARLGHALGLARKLNAWMVTILKPNFAMPTDAGLQDDDLSQLRILQCYERTWLEYGKNGLPYVESPMLINDLHWEHSVASRLVVDLFEAPSPIVMQTADRVDMRRLLYDEWSRAFRHVARGDRKLLGPMQAAYDAGRATSLVDGATHPSGKELMVLAREQWPQLDDEQRLDAIDQWLKSEAGLSTASIVSVRLSEALELFRDGCGDNASDDEQPIVETKPLYELRDEGLVLVCGNRVYSQTSSQAAIVKVLFEAWKAGRPSMPQDSIREAVYQSMDRGPQELRAVFRGNSAGGKKGRERYALVWREVIEIGDRRNTLQLKDPKKLLESPRDTPRVTPR